MVLSKVNLKESIKIDFTGSVSSFEQFKSYGDEVVSLVRNSQGPKVLVVIDRGFACEKKTPYIIRDHLNLSGSNPLVGPNDPLGERFPSVNDIYVTDALAGLTPAVAAGLKPGVVPSADELKLIRSLGGDFYCYHLVPTMIVAAHARWHVLGIVIPEGVELGSDILSAIENGGGN